MLIIDMRLAAL